MPRGGGVLNDHSSGYFIFDGGNGLRRLRRADDGSHVSQTAAANSATSLNRDADLDLFQTGTTTCTAISPSDSP